MSEKRYKSIVKESLDQESYLKMVASSPTSCRGVLSNGFSISTKHKNAAMIRSTDHHILSQATKKNNQGNNTKEVKRTASALEIDGDYVKFQIPTLVNSLFDPKSIQSRKCCLKTLRELLQNKNNKTPRLSHNGQLNKNRGLKLPPVNKINFQINKNVYKTTNTQKIFVNLRTPNHQPVGIVKRNISVDSRKRDRIETEHTGESNEATQNYSELRTERVQKLKSSRNPKCTKEQNCCLSFKSSYSGSFMGAVDAYSQELPHAFHSSSIDRRVPGNIRNTDITDQEEYKYTITKKMQKPHNTRLLKPLNTHSLKQFEVHSNGIVSNKGSGSVVWKWGERGKRLFIDKRYSQGNMLN